MFAVITCFYIRKCLNAIGGGGGRGQLEWEKLIKGRP